MTAEVVTIADVLHEWRRKAVWDRVAARTETGDFVTVLDARKEIVSVRGMDGRHDWISRSKLFPVWWPEAQFGVDDFQDGAAGEKSKTR